MAGKKRTRWGKLGYVLEEKKRWSQRVTKEPWPESAILKLVGKTQPRGNIQMNRNVFN